MEKDKETRKFHDCQWDLVSGMPHLPLHLIQEPVLKGGFGEPRYGTICRIRDDKASSGFNLVDAHLELLTDTGWSEINRASFSLSNTTSRETAHNLLKDYAEYVFAGRQKNQ